MDNEKKDVKEDPSAWVLLWIPCVLMTICCVIRAYVSFAGGDSWGTATFASHQENAILLGLIVGIIADWFVVETLASHQNRYNDHDF